MKRTMCVGLCATILIAGCAGRTASPVPRTMPGDEGRDCVWLSNEIQQCQQEQEKKREIRGNKTAANIVMAIGGIFLIVPWFFMDLKNAEGTEIEALHQRQLWLESLSVEKGCGQ